MNFCPKKLAYLCLEAPREGQASYTHVHEIIAGLRRRGWLVSLYTPPYASRWLRPNLVFRLLHYLVVQCRLMLGWWKFDTIYVRAHPAAFPIGLLARLTGKPIVHEINGAFDDLYIVYPGARRWRRPIDNAQRLQFVWASGLIAVTDQLVTWLKSMMPEGHVVKIANGANVELFTPEAGTKIALPEKFIVFCGGLAEWHGIDMMLQAADDIVWPADMHLVLIGDGPRAAAVAEAGIANPLIVPLGRLAYDEVPGVLARALAGLACIGDPNGRSEFTGVSPLKLFESLACGTPVIVTNLPSLAEFVTENRCGLVVPVDDSHALAEAVRTLSVDLELARQLGRRGADTVRNGHSWDRRAQDTHEFISSVLALRY